MANRPYPYYPAWDGKQTSAGINTLVQLCAARWATKNLGTYVHRNMTNIPPPLNVKSHLKGEVKYKDFLSNTLPAPNALWYIDLSGIAQGTARDERLGDEVKILRVDMVGYNGGQWCGQHLVSTLSNAVPLATDFINAPGGPPSNDTMMQWYSNVGGSRGEFNSVQATYSFKYPLKVTYNGDFTTSGFRNRLFYCLTNFTSYALPSVPKIAIRVWFQE